MTSQMDQWVNRRHPQTLSGAVMLSYVVGVNMVISGAIFNPVGLVLMAGLVGGAFMCANDRSLGHVVMSSAAGLIALYYAYVLAIHITRSPSQDIFGWVNPILSILISAVFPVCLLVAALHPMSRNYVKAYFD